MTAHMITWTIYSEQARAHYENHARIDRKYPLTHAGCERILRRELQKPTLNVVRVEKMSAAA